MRKCKLYTEYYIVNIDLTTVIIYNDYIAHNRKL